jgi:hypothetical protein
MLDATACDRGTVHTDRAWEFLVLFSLLGALEREPKDDKIGIL